ncbi:type II toxin-antitoxin system prevent-host-death family antitoxin [Arthrobacter sp. H5]|uniref:type II toxin-antitoxin system Phd/YefM family antitoxin n=1 Tax=Arthrobacter sp. H5 TaxID=1267973 RepID=UPI0020A6CB5E|nr:type II toxin-antitoxin system prevent-host-death family antitoxin [Arthrobacter sp. H5]
MTTFDRYEYWPEPYTAEVDQVDLVNMGQYNVQEAKTKLSELLHMVERGDEVIIARGGRPVAKLVKLERPLKRTLGFLGPLDVPAEAFEPMTGEEKDLWEQPLT